MDDRLRDVARREGPTSKLARILAERAGTPDPFPNLVNVLAEVIDAKLRAGRYAACPCDDPYSPTAEHDPNEWRTFLNLRVVRKRRRVEVRCRSYDVDPRVVVRPIGFITLAPTTPRLPEFAIDLYRFAQVAILAHGHDWERPWSIPFDRDLAAFLAQWYGDDPYQEPEYDLHRDLAGLPREFLAAMAQRIAEDMDALIVGGAVDNTDVRLSGIAPRPDFSGPRLLGNEDERGRPPPGA